MNDAENRIDNIFRGMSVLGLGWTNAYGYFTQMWIGRLRLHVFFKGEPSVMMHDHAWPFWTFPLVSYVDRTYVPETGKSEIRIVRAWRLHYRPSSYIHKYLGRWSGGYDANGVPTVKPGRVYTIAWRGRLDRQWGYWKPTLQGLKRFEFREYLETIEARFQRMAIRRKRT
jgi:hypothetical protein